MKKYYKVMLLILTIMFLSACAGGGGDEVIQMATFKDIDSIYIENGSSDIDIVSADIDEMESYFHLYDNGPGIVMAKGGTKIND
ncbi:hypothetical protein [Viridibacillus arvi]|uniref:hypothetical protein n=1 Tax=Viridibacillus arvi TaxID=263475 RepID=UPI0034CEDA65